MEVKTHPGPWQAPSQATGGHGRQQDSFGTSRGYGIRYTRRVASVIQTSHGLGSMDQGTWALTLVQTASGVCRPPHF